MSNRLDATLVNKAIATSREKAKALIKTGKVKVEGVIITKPAFQVEEDFKIEIIGNLLPYVSRGGLKLEGALNSFGINLKDAVCLDVGASTGGFTDCMLQRGAQYVYAVDVGKEQLHKKLKNDRRVMSIESINIRYFDFLTLEKKIDFISVDVSFISLSLVMPVLLELIQNGAQAVVLIKPQFEVGKENLGKKGIVKKPKLHVQVLLDFIKLCESLNLNVTHIDFSGIKGLSGNIEYVAHIVHKSNRVNIIGENECKHIVKRAHSQLNEKKYSYITN